MIDQGFDLGFVPFYFVSDTLVEMYVLHFTTLFRYKTIALALLKCEFLYQGST
jgi:hypothetical protein